MNRIFTAEAPRTQRTERISHGLSQIDTDKKSFRVITNKRE